jgi:mono/diheme cytochrome c family protein
MQIKIVIGTVAFMLTMVVLGYAALREPARMELYQQAEVARKIEKGADLYANNCSTCHGEQGKAEVCYNGDGEQIGCAGLPLNNPELLCGEPSARLVAMQWNGTRYQYINSTLMVGRPQNGMPTWGAPYGGPLEPYQIDYLTEFILNWETEEMCSAPTPTPVPWPSSVAELPVGDPAAGADLYNVTYGCAACHGDLNTAGSANVGPWAGEFALEGGTRIEGYTSADYLYESILLPSAFIALECPNGPCAGPPSAMPANFGQRMNPQHMADVMAYLLGTTTFEANQTITYP